MRRILTIGVALGVLAALVGTAIAAGDGNNYTVKYVFAPKGAGSKAKPKPVSVTLDYTASNTNSSLRTEPIVDVTTKMYGVISTVTKSTPKCTLAYINKNTDAKCPKKALVAQGFIHATIAPSLSKAVPATVADCHPILDVWNSGPGKLTFVFDAPQNQNLCGPIHTGAAPPYPGTVKQVGKYLVVDAQVGEAVTFPVGLYGSLNSEHLVWFKFVQASVACKGHSRPTTTIFTSEASKGGTKHKVSKSFAAKC